jgi:hypothetical protein
MILGAVIGLAVAHFLDAERGGARRRLAVESIGGAGDRLRNKLSIFVGRNADRGADGLVQPTTLDAAVEPAERPEAEAAAEPAERPEAAAEPAERPEAAAEPAERPEAAAEEPAARSDVAAPEPAAPPARRTTTPEATSESGDQAPPRTGRANTSSQRLQ